MTKSDEAKFVALMSGMAMSYRQEIGEPLLAVWWAALEDLDFATLAAAVNKAVRECEFMPSVAELRNIARPKRVHYEHCDDVIARIYGRRPGSEPAAIGESVTDFVKKLGQP